MKKTGNIKQKGFTIIEVLIVLAIAGLIMLVVFLAVPALQRNARNTVRKSEVSSIAAGIVEWINNNGGQAPSTPADKTAALSNTMLQYYSYTTTPPTITWATSGTNGALSNVDHARIATAAKCSSGGTTIPASSRSIAVQYMVETGGGIPQAMCIET